MSSRACRIFQGKRIGIIGKRLEGQREEMGFLISEAESKR
jgi:hypothetical protein